MKEKLRSIAIIDTAAVVAEATGYTENYVRKVAKGVRNNAKIEEKLREANLKLEQIKK
jgi:hypothetical protein